MGRADPRYAVLQENHILIVDDNEGAIFEPARTLGLKFFVC